MKKLVSRISGARNLLLLPVATLLLVGCSTTDSYVDQPGQELVTYDEINFQDFNSAGIRLAESLIASGRLNRMDGSVPIIMQSRIDNRTTQHLDTELLTSNIRIALSQSGKAAFTTAVAAGGPEDAASFQARELRQSEEFNQSTVAGTGQMRAPDFSLAGRVIELSTYRGRTGQAAFTFQLVLTDLTSGVGVWEGQEQIVKQGKRPGIGL